MSNFGKRLRSTASEYIPLVIGEQYGGGYYAGQMRFDGAVWLVVAAPRALAANASIMFATTASTRPDGLSAYDGNLNHQLIKAAGLSTYPAAKWCDDLTIGGFNDWHIPALLEMDIVYRAFRPANTPNTSYGENPYAVPPKGRYTSTDPAYTTVPEYQTGGSEAFEPNHHLTSSPNETALVGVQLINFNGGVTAQSATNSNRYLRPTRLVRTNLP